MEPMGSLPSDGPAVPGSSPESPPANNGDGDLVRSAIAGDRRAFDVLVRKYQKQAVSVAYSYLSNADDAQEVTQDAFIKAFTSLSTLQKPDAFCGWLMRTVSNLSLNFRRGRRLRKNPGLD